MLQFIPMARDIGFSFALVEQVSKCCSPDLLFVACRRHVNAGLIAQG